MKARSALLRNVSAVFAVLAALVWMAPSAFALNCVQFAQMAGPVGLHGDAYQWWNNALGRYDRGHEPHPGSVMVFAKTKALPHGHVAIVRAVKDKRKVLVDHANWSPVRGRRGQVERAVEVVDVSRNNDWSRVRVWFAPTADIGSTVYPVVGFVYPAKPLPIHHHLR